MASFADLSANLQVDELFLGSLVELQERAPMIKPVLYFDPAPASLADHRELLAVLFDQVRLEFVFCKLGVAVTPEGTLNFDLFALLQEVFTILFVGETFFGLDTTVLALSEIYLVVKIGLLFLWQSLCEQLIGRALSVGTSGAPELLQTTPTERRMTTRTIHRRQLDQPQAQMAPQFSDLWGHISGLIILNEVDIQNDVLDLHLFFALPIP